MMIFKNIIESVNINFIDCFVPSATIWVWKGGGGGQEGGGLAI